jgi:hypothetical protein
MQSTKPGREKPETSGFLARRLSEKPSSSSSPAATKRHVERSRGAAERKPARAPPSHPPLRAPFRPSEPPSAAPASPPSPGGGIHAHALAPRAPPSPRLRTNTTSCSCGCGCDARRGFGCGHGCGHHHGRSGPSVQRQQPAGKARRRRSELVGKSIGNLFVCLSGHFGKTVRNVWGDRRDRRRSQEIALDRWIALDRAPIH